MVKKVKFVDFCAWKERYGQRTQNTSAGNFVQGYQRCNVLDLTQHDPQIIKIPQKNPMYPHILWPHLFLEFGCCNFTFSSGLVTSAQIFKAYFSYGQQRCWREGSLVTQSMPISCGAFLTRACLYYPPLLFKKSKCYETKWQKFYLRVTPYLKGDRVVQQ